MKNNQILKIYGTDYKEMTAELLTRADLLGRIKDKSCRIGIKPNLVSPSPASCGATTHPEVVAGIIEYLRSGGCSNIVLMEGSWVGDKTSEAIGVCGYDVLAKEYGVPFIDTQKEGAYAKDCAGLELRICDCVRDVDFMINVPVLKGHCQTRITCALKNMKGLLPNKEKRRFHAMGLHEPIAHLAMGIRQDFVVIDHICGDLDFEDGGNPVVRNCVMAACDPVLADAYACRLLHYDVAEVPYIKMAEALGAGSANLEQAQILTCRRDVLESLEAQGHPAETGLEKETLWFLEGPDEELPLSRRTVELRDAVEEVESCSACYGYLIPALDRLREEGLLKKLDDKICIGQGYRGRTGHIGIGQCTAGFAHHVAGCPPTEGQIYEFLKEYIHRIEAKES
ncbi:DUF362 domain-containing protein [Parablautia sp. Marseille-Q6255]|uniref:DUF362 domain-containing protein n=1 Tax=Parablautia sp. Marseille-Q6255 TaxID=3039593 RepID=UPI0024BC37CC|nr:DUF362 domain-containing protein [Parablautia sp. Marseille-Q6255]